jgi:hypothetical protein
MRRVTINPWSGLCPAINSANPMDMEFAANGDLYMLEYGDWLV